MAYTFGSVDIVAFDAHTAVRPVAFPQLVKPEFGFLVDSKKYRQQYESWQKVETDAFTIRPIKKREFSRNHFWKNYAGMSFSAERDYWGLQIPFVFEPKNLTLAVNTQGFNFQVQLECAVYLNAIGWSSNVRMRLAGNITSGQLQAFVGRLRGLDKGQLPFVFAGSGQSLTSVFKGLGATVRKGVYAAPNNVGDRISVSNQLVISPGRFAAQLKYFDDQWGLTPAMDDDERAQVLGMLYGRQLDVGNAAELKRYRDKTTVTRFRDTNFSLTNYDQGTLLFMQEQAAGTADRTESLRCLAFNIRSCTVMSLAALSFERWAISFVDDSPVLKALQESANTTLATLSESYDNAYCKNFFRHHRQLKKFLGGWETETDDIPF